MIRQWLIASTFIILAPIVWGNNALTYNCSDANDAVSIALNEADGEHFIIVTSCNDSTGFGTTYTFSHCSESFKKGRQPGYLFHKTGDISEVQTFTIDCQNSSNGNANVSNVLRNITINTVHPQNNFDFNMTIVQGNSGYYLGQAIQVTLKAAEPYSIKPVKCVASSSVNPNISIVLWENGTTQRPYLLSNFSGTCNTTLTATMYGFRFVDSTGISLTCAAMPCTVHIEDDEPPYTDEKEALGHTWHQEGDDYLGLLPEMTIARTVTVNII